MLRKTLIDFAFRNISFFDFLNISLDNWQFVLHENANENVPIKQKIFRQRNDHNLLNYKEEERIAQIVSEEGYTQKFKKIEEWAKIYKKKLSKNMNFNEINSLIDDIIYPEIKDKLKSLKDEKNPILNLMFPQLINNLFESFDLLIKIKLNLFSDLKKEMDKYSNLLIQSEENDNQLKKEIKEYKKEIKQIKQNKNQLEIERTNFITKINSIEEELRIIKEKYAPKEKILVEENNFSSRKYEAIDDLNKNLFVINENLSSDIMALKEENKYLIQELKKVEENQKASEKNYMEELRKEREERIKYQNQLMCDLKIEKDKRIKLEKEYENDKIQREKRGKDLANLLTNNYNEALKRVIEAFNLQEKK